MPDFLKAYYDTEGPFGIPMRDRQAQALDAMVKDLPREAPYEPHLAVVEKGPSELLPGERADVSWISEESVDRQGEIVLAAGMDDSHFKLNPLVTMQHAYWMPPVGRSLWRKRVRDGALSGIKASVHWHDSIDDVPDGPALIFANEYFDALPINQAVLEHDGWHERVVDVNDRDQLVFDTARDPLPRGDLTLSAPSCSRGPRSCPGAS